MREYIRKNKLTIYVFFVGVLCLITGGALAFFNASFRGIKEQTLNIGENLTFTYNETGSALALDNNDIMSNDKGKAKTSYFDFNIKLKADTLKTVKYNIYLTKSTTSTLDNSKLKIYLTDQSNNVIKDVTSVQSLQIFSKYDNSYLLYQKEITSTNNTEATDYYRLRVWIDDSLGTSITENDGVHTIEEPNFSYKFTVNVDVGDSESGTMLTSMILGDGNSNVLNATATLTDTYSSAGDASGLYKSVDGETNSGTTYFYRGAVTNNYVLFANLGWRIVRINEDGSVRLLLAKGINNKSSYIFNPNSDNYTYMYYSNSDVEGGIKRTVDTWYNSNLKDYENYIADTKFCEQFKVAWSSTDATAGSVTAPLYSSYTSNFKCSTDGNGKGVLTSKIGLLTYDEAIHAGNYPGKVSNSYIKNSKNWYWLMSPDGVNSADAYAYVWGVDTDGYIGYNFVNNDVDFVVCPVISLKANVFATGTGIKSDPYVVK